MLMDCIFRFLCFFYKKFATRLFICLHKEKVSVNNPEPKVDPSVEVCEQHEDVKDQDGCSNI